ncbi:MAG: hypothetical protein V4641_05450 [Pseudomonadota bacterium]
MIGAVLLLAMSASASTPSVAFCNSLAHLTFVANDARNSGVTQAQAEAAAYELADPDARDAGLTVIWYVYQSNDDRRISSRKLAQLVRHACLVKDEP